MVTSCDVSLCCIPNFFIALIGAGFLCFGEPLGDMVVILAGPGAAA